MFVTGGTGLVGPYLIRALAERGDRVMLLTRRPEAARQLGLDCEIVVGDPMQAGTWQDAIADCDAVVNLAGANLLGCWNAAYKALLVSSRVQSTDHCSLALAKKPTRADGSPKVLVNASAIGYYGPHGDEQLDETNPPGHDFLADLCAKWEEACAAVLDAGVRTVFLRIGVVLEKHGGALKKLLLPFKLGLGGPIASGRQYLSWVHHADVVGLILFVLDRANIRGPLNATAPDPRPNKAFGQALGHALGRPAFFWTPAFAVKLVIGQGAETVTTGQRVWPKKARRGLFVSLPHARRSAGGPCEITLGLGNCTIRARQRREKL